MDIAATIKKLIKEGELYHRQSLTREAKEKYQKAADLIGKLEKLKNKDQLLLGIKKKIRQIEEDYKKFQESEATPEVEEKVQDLIKQQFAFGKEGDAATLEGAIALAKFGQFERALKEFNDLLQIDSMRIVAAKNIVRCCMSLDDSDRAIDAFGEWAAGDIFTDQQLDNLRVFFQNILDKKGIERQLPSRAPQPDAIETVGEIEPEPLEVEMVEVEDGDEDLLDVSSIGIMFEEGPEKGNLIEFDVSFQSGNEISLLIPSRDKNVIEHLKAGTKIQDIEFYSPFAMFKGAGMVTANTKISTGPKRGDFSLDIKVIRA